MSKQRHFNCANEKCGRALEGGKYIYKVVFTSPLMPKVTFALCPECYDAIKEYDFLSQIRLTKETP
jgi:hypothetical protein